MSRAEEEGQNQKYGFNLSSSVVIGLFLILIASILFESVLVSQFPAMALQIVIAFTAFQFLILGFIFLGLAWEIGWVKYGSAIAFALSLWLIVNLLWGR